MSKKPAHDDKLHDKFDAPVSKKPALVKMVRDAPWPHEADVHPDEVENYRVGGWHLAKK